MKTETGAKAPPEKKAPANAQESHQSCQRGATEGILGRFQFNRCDGVPSSSILNARGPTKGGRTERIAEDSHFVQLVKEVIEE